MASDRLSMIAQCLATPGLRHYRESLLRWLEDQVVGHFCWVIQSATKPDLSVQPVNADLAPMPFRGQRSAEGFQKGRQRLGEGIGRIDDE